jgi:hypothetical protein
MTGEQPPGQGPAPSAGSPPALAGILPNITSPIPATLLVPGNPVGVEVQLMAPVQVGDRVLFTGGQEYTVLKVTCVLEQDAFQNWQQTKIELQF